MEKSLGEQIFEVLQIICDVLLLFMKIFYALGESIYRKICPTPPQSVTNKIVLITGTGHGIGKELALLYAAEGATVVGIDINEKNNEQTLYEIKSKGYPKAYSYICDVSNRDQVISTVNRIENEVGNISILINNAGIMPTHSFLDQTVSEIENVFKINVFAHFWLLQAILPGMKRRNDGHIVALSSCAGIIGLENLVPYCGTKFAVRGYMEALSEEIRQEKLNIKFTTIYPYITDTGLCKNVKIRFDKTMAPLDPKIVAKNIINAQRTNSHFVEISIPNYLISLNNITRLLPIKAAIYVRDFFESGVLPE